MGTRCLTVFVDGETEIAVLYRQFDGYPDGHGLELAKILDGHYMVNGHNADPRQYNGMHDLAVRVITALKENPNEVGNLYLYPAKTRDMDEEYVYFVSSPDEKTIQIKAFEDNLDNKPFFVGSPEKAIKQWGKK